MKEFSESHCDDVTQVRFHPDNFQRLLSGSEDGLCCIFDLTQMDDEDEALLMVRQTGSSVQKLGYFGPKSEYVWVLNRIETFSIWTAEELLTLVM